MATDEIAARCQTSQARSDPKGTVQRVRAWLAVRRWLVFIDRLLATLVHLRHGATHDVLACLFEVDRSTITRTGASGQTGIIDGTEVRVRRPAVGRNDREEFISGKKKQNAVEAMVLTDANCRLLFCGPAQPASCADITHARQMGLVRTTGLRLVPGPVRVRRPGAGSGVS
ncbi:transposase family protein [Streptomyces goshikiensis]|uniref:transposase n=1 Tax=Streptomyces goshikiensis TaxID=1942 RepID=UPI001E5DAEFB|nr:transposase [Streptomyces goshikiensis]